ncbi:MAG: phosphate acyltransferase PlsX [Actinomycetota bacterium]|nr:phosphate acyltransferase PlsX [Actinomycetota bacterium]
MIALDANGADSGPAAVAEGALLSGEDVLLFGPATQLAGRHVVDAPVKIGGHEEPVRAVRSKPEASIVQAARAVAEGRAEALVSAGSTGPTLAAATVSLKRIRGVHRPALAALLPLPGGPALLLDAGATVESRPELLVQFAHMGVAFMEGVLGVPRPKVGLLSVGEESGKGTPEVIEARARLEDGSLRFVGNVEGFDVPSAAVQVIVTDGFTGNVALKVMEGTSRTVALAMKDAVRSSPVSALGGLLVKGAMGGVRDRLDPERAGGAILLGLRKPVVVAHGSFGPKGIAAAVRLASRAVDEDVVGRTSAALEDAGALRSAPVGSVAGTMGDDVADES